MRHSGLRGLSIPGAKAFKIRVDMVSLQLQAYSLLFSVGIITEYECPAAPKRCTHNSAPHKATIQATPR